MDLLGISERELIDKHLRPLLMAKRTIFAQKGGKFTDKRTVDALETQIRALHLAFLLHGSYAPRDPKEAAEYGVKVIVNDLGLLRGENGRPPIDIKPGMAIPELPTHSTIGAKPAVPKNSERQTDRRQLRMSLTPDCRCTCRADLHRFRRSVPPVLTIRKNHLQFSRKGTDCGYCGINYPSK